MNELDSEIIASQLIAKKIKQVDDEDSADLIILNTCSIRDLAEKKVYAKLNQYKKKKIKIIGLLGCMAMARKKDLLNEFPNIDFIIGTNNLLDINSVIDSFFKKKKRIQKTSLTYEKKLENFFTKRNNKIKAFISIIRGCSNFCSYCIVPHTRGREISRHFKSIIKESKMLADLGYREITLLGQNVNSYGRDKPQWNFLFHDLLYELNKINGIERIRFITSHPKDITKDLMYAIRDLKKVCEFVHFPLQSGSNKILEKMNRKYTQEDYLEKVNLLKEIVPNVAIGTDIIVGFPKETDEDFEKTYKLFKTIDYDLAFIFAYSPRQNTVAAKLKDDVTEYTKQKRLQRLLKLYRSLLNKKYEKKIGLQEEVLVERLNKDNLQLKGKTKRFEKVIFKGDKKLIGTIQRVKIENFKHQTLLATLVEN